MVSIRTRLRLLIILAIVVLLLNALAVTNEKTEFHSSGSDCTPATHQPVALASGTHQLM